MLLVGIVVGGEGVEGADLAEDGAELIFPQGADSLGEEDLAALEAAAEGIVQAADAFGFCR